MKGNRYNSLEMHKCGKLKRQKTARIFVKFDMSIFRKFVQKIQAALKSDKNNQSFT